MNGCPTITTEFIERVEEMRKAQVEYYELATAKDAHNNRFVLTRMLQKAKALEQKVDAMMAQYREDIQKWIALTEPKKHSEVQGEYNFQSETEKT
jgi:hypothetical protein